MWQGENLQAMALRMCEDCVRDVFADGGAVCRKYATTIRETIQCELQQRNYDPSPCMHLTGHSGTQPTASSRCRVSAPWAFPFQHDPPRLSLRESADKTQGILHNFSRRKQKQVTMITDVRWGREPRRLQM